MEMRREALELEEQGEELLREAIGDPSPETNDASLTLGPVVGRAGSLMAAERALGGEKLWAEHVMSLAVWPAATLTAAAVIAMGEFEAGLPFVLGVLVAALLGYGIGGHVPRALAVARRVPLVVLAGAASGLGACVGALTMSAVALASRHVAHPETWVLGGASFGLVYAGLLFLPSLLVRLGHVHGALFALARGAAIVLAVAYASWNA